MSSRQMRGWAQWVDDNNWCFEITDEPHAGQEPATLTLDPEYEVRAPDYSYRSEHDVLRLSEAMRAAESPAGWWSSSSIEVSRLFLRILEAERRQTWALACQMYRGGDPVPHPVEGFADVILMGRATHHADGGQ